MEARALVVAAEESKASLTNVGCTSSRMAEESKASLTAMLALSRWLSLTAMLAVPHIHAQP